MSAMMPVDITLTVSEAPGHKYDSAWSASAYVDAHGNMDFRKVVNPASITIHVKGQNLNVSFDPAADQAVMIEAGATGTCPTTPASKLPTGAPFQGFTHPGNDPATIQFANSNNDHMTWTYGLNVIRTNDDGTTETIVVDPAIINH